MRRKLRFRLDGASASAELRSLAGFQQLRALLRANNSFANALDRLDAIEHALERKHKVKLPCPRRLLQNGDCSLTLFWGGITLRCFAEGCAALIGGQHGAQVVGIKPELLAALAIQAKRAG